MKGYKALLSDMSSRYGYMTYEIGKKYTISGPLKMCKNGYHFCTELENIEQYYPISKSRIFKVEADGKMIHEDSKYCAKSITLIRELSKEEIRQYFEDNQDRILNKGYKAKSSMAEQKVCLDKLIDDENWHVRATVAKQGYGLDKLINDEDWCVREAVAEQGYGLDKLIDDEDWCVRMTVAEQSYGLDKLIDDENWHVRATVAEQGYGLDKLINDENWCVREAVAEQGYGLDKLIDDEDWYVQNTARKMLFNHKRKK